MIFDILKKFIFKPKIFNPSSHIKLNKNTCHLICNGKNVPIKHNRVITFKDKNGYVAPPGTYSNIYRKEGINNLVVHFDVCVNSKQCFDVLKQRSLSVHFLIDWDGTIYQTLDTSYVAWHAAGVNMKSVGVEINNPFYIQHQQRIKELGQPERPIITNSEIHNRKLENHLGFHISQMEALKSLIEALHEGIGLKLQTPSLLGVMPDVLNYQGIIHHYHVNRNKIDACGIDVSSLLA